jgi:hypothetical protein
MKILIGNVVLAGGVENHESPHDISIQNERAVQIAETLRGSVAKSYDRGNQRTVLNFKVTRRHDSTEAAQMFTLAHAASLSDLSTFVRVVEEPSGIVFILSDAAIASVQSSSVGNVSMHEYHIVGGNFSQMPIQ